MIFTVAIDGPAAAGKGTIAREISSHFGFPHLDTGLIYRATAARVIAGEEAIEAARDLRAEDLLRDDLRSVDIAQAASRVAAIPEVRDALTSFQRRFARQPGGAVLDGRDIGTVICPEAEVKLFVTASAEVRAERRYLELSATDPSLTREAVLQAVKERDARDAARDVAPMAAAEDAILFDTSDMSVDQAVATAKSEIAARLK